MELDYYNSNSFAIGLNSVSASTGNSNNDPFIMIPGQDESTIKWKKIYLDLTSYVTIVDNAVSFDFYIVSALDAEKTNSFVYLDNIKIVQFD